MELHSDNHSDNYKKELNKRANKHLIPYIGKKPVANITPQQMIEILKRIEILGLLETLRKIKAIASQVFRYCVGVGVLDSDPTRDIPTNIFKKQTVKNYATITDPKQIGILLNDIDNYVGTFNTIQALKLAPLIFLRPTELASLKWEYIDWDNEQIKLPPEVMKMNTAHIVPLSKQSIKILRLSQSVEINSPFIFPSTLSPKIRHITAESLRGGLRRMGYTNEQITTHGFRGMASTLLHEQGYNTDYIERQLAHQERNKIKGAYNHAEHLIERKQMMNDWADYLDTLKG